MKKIFIGSMVLALGVGGYLWYQAKEIPTSTSTPTVEESIPESVPVLPVAGTDTFRNLMARSGDLECTITTRAQNSDPLTGTYFASNGRVRVDVGVEGEIPTTSFSNVTSMTVNDSGIYLWTFIDGEGYGAKTMLVNETIATAKPEPGKQTPIDFDGEVTYDCKPWEVVDNSVFEPPSTIIFKDYTTAMEAGMEDGTVYPEGITGPTLTPEDMQSGDPCALCAKVAPGEGQDQCRANFKCGS